MRRSHSGKEACRFKAPISGVVTIGSAVTKSTAACGTTAAVGTPARPSW